jgi:serine/threonine protein kinase
MNERLAKAEALFHDALELPVKERDSFLQKACLEDPELRCEVAALLHAAGIADDWLKDEQGPRSPRREAGDLERSGTIIGRYKLLEKIGEGGFGVVYMSEQQEPVRRKVALKIIKLGMDTRSVIARFEAERQALAMMDHPNIAKVLDAGTTDTGRPYFVMELVRGVPITKFCEENQLNVSDRLALFVQVCGAIQHAHQKGIIHRDIKPTNVLVTLNDGVPHPMVIDFGVAKALNQRLTEKTLFTNFAQMIGTPAYMSPEQAEMSKLDVDTRSDVYSLGVLLYELLTGTTPFPEERLRSAGYAEMQRIICQEEPERPSTRLTRSLVAADVVAADVVAADVVAADVVAADVRRRTSAFRAPHSAFPTDLDWIVMKCLEKDRMRRYDTTSGLTADLTRFLKNEPIMARAPGKVYRLQKLLRRHRAGLLVAAGIVAALLVGMAATTFLRKPLPVIKPFDAALPRLPKRTPETPPNLIDLSKFYNVSLDGNGTWQLSPSSEHAIQKGPQRFGEVLFDVRGAVRLFSPHPSYAKMPFPQGVEGIEMSRKCRRLHFLHFVFNSAPTGVKVATYRVHYRDGTIWEIPLKYGAHVRTWAASTRSSADPRYDLEATNSVLASMRTNVAGIPVRLFRTAWDNPTPDAEVKTIDFISNMTECVPVLVSITAEP